MKIGVDNGQAGAAFAILDNGDIKWVVFKPWKKESPHEPFAPVDPAYLRAWLLALPDEPVEVLLEAPALNQGAKTTATAIASTSASYSLILDAFRTLLPRAVVHTCPAITWQKLLWNVSIKHEDKPSVPMAIEKFKWSFIPPGCKTPHDGLTDAAMMASVLTMPGLRALLLESLKEILENAAKKKIKKKNAARLKKETMAALQIENADPNQGP